MLGFDCAIDGNNNRTASCLCRCNSLDCVPHTFMNVSCIIHILVINLMHKKIHNCIEQRKRYTNSKLILSTRIQCVKLKLVPLSHSIFTFISIFLSAADVSMLLMISSSTNVLIMEFDSFIFTVDVRIANGDVLGTYFSMSYVCMRMLRRNQSIHSL